MEQVINLEKSYATLTLYAQLQHRVGRDAQALAIATAAIEVAREAGEESSEAAALLAELQPATKK